MAEEKKEGGDLDKLMEGFHKALDKLKEFRDSLFAPPKPDEMGRLPGRDRGPGMVAPRGEIPGPVFAEQKDPKSLATYTDTPGFLLDPQSESLPTQLDYFKSRMPGDDPGVFDDIGTYGKEVLVKNPELMREILRKNLIDQMTGSDRPPTKISM